MDQSIRNKLRSVVTQCRKLLEEAVRQVLQGQFGIYETGKKDEVHVEDEGRMKNLSDEDKGYRRDIQAHLGHIEALGYKAKDALAQLVREIAFTHLNRLCAYKMMEARAVWIGGKPFREAVSRGVKSQGFQFYLADHPEDKMQFDTGHQDVAYRHFLGWLGVNLSEEIGVLFSPTDPANRLFPPHRVLDDVLALLNSDDLKDIWSVDETIGWVYQYFTPKELRDQVRKESAAPRNSYELAFRNQFFTPRYVVEFLTDNTLGRIWYEMRLGETKLKDQCRYMVRRPSELFLVEGQSPPEPTPSQDELSQEDRLKQPVHIPHRPKKDPRELRILDPACGSGHFLLYCFDLLLTIYEEAYADPDLGPKLKEEYPMLEALHRDAPRLILVHNLHGIDIDLRASQIAALALWLRCQRAYREMNLKQDRPNITKSNIVCAEPMPGEKEILDEFLKTLKQDRLETLIRRVMQMPEGTRIRATESMVESLNELVRLVWDKMRLAGEAGSLLKIEEELQEAVRKGQDEWEEKQPLFRFTEFSLTEKPKETYVRYVPAEGASFWHRAEALVLEALRDYSRHAADGGRLQRQLFAEDAERGFAFIDVCRKRFDVVLMNPPFGLPTSRVLTLLKAILPQAYTNMYAAFLMRSGDFCRDGIVGAISSRSFLMTPRLTGLRQDFLLDRLELLLDLGLSVMDEAEVESCAYTLRASKPATFPIIACDLRLEDDKEHHIAMIGKGKSRRLIAADTSVLRGLPGSRIFYSLSSQIIRLFNSGSVFSPSVGTARCGGRTFDNFRFLRVHWEVSPDTIGTDAVWVPFCKGGDYSPYYGAIPLLINWENDGNEIAQKNIEVNGQTAQARQASTYYFRKGGTYSRRSKAFGVRVMPRGCIFGEKGPAVFSEGEVPEAYIIGWLNTSLIRQLVEMQANKSQYDTGSVCRLPWRCPVDASAIATYAQLTIELVGLSRAIYEWVENDHAFGFWANASSLAELAHRRNLEVAALGREIEALKDRWNAYVGSLYGVSASDVALFEENLTGETDADADDSGPTESEDTDVPLPEITPDVGTRLLLSVGIGVAYGRWDVRRIKGGTDRVQSTDPFLSLPTHAQVGLAETARSAVPSRPSIYPIRVDYDGILVDDHDHSDDIIRRVRDVLEVIWNDRADAVEKEACEILGIKELRDYFRKPGKGGFWDDHVSRYSKSRRKAPIYWLLQSSKKNYGLWLYYHRLDKDILFKARQNYVDPKIRLEQTRLDSLRSQKSALGADAKGAKKIDKEIERQESLLGELKDFAEKLERAAKLNFGNTENAQLRRVV
jgi:hypothetical protein